MQKCMSDYLDSVCSEIRRKSLREAARAELCDHLTLCRDKLVEDGMDIETASLEAVRRMGDPCVLGIKITAANRNPAGKLTLFAGLVLATVTVCLIILWSGGGFRDFLDPATLIGVAGLSSAYGLLSGGGKPTLVSFFHGVRTGGIYAGIIVMIAGIVIFLCNWDDPAMLGQGIAMSIISVLYGVIVSASARIAESWLAIPASGVIRGILE